MSFSVSKHFTAVKSSASEWVFYIMLQFLLLISLSISSSYFLILCRIKVFEAFFLI